MHAIYHLKANELNDHFLESIRLLFQDRMIDITIADTPLPHHLKCRIGIAKGLFDVPDDIDGHNDEVARLFLGGDMDQGTP